MACGQFVFLYANMANDIQKVYPFFPPTWGSMRNEVSIHEKTFPAAIEQFTLINLKRNG